MLWATTTCPQASTLVPLHTHKHTHTLSESSSGSRLWSLVLLSSLTIIWKQGFELHVTYSSVSSLLSLQKNKKNKHPTQWNLWPSYASPPHSVGSNWPGVLHEGARCWELVYACYEAIREISKYQVADCATKSCPSLVTLLTVNLFMRRYPLTTGVFLSRVASFKGSAVWLDMRGCVSVHVGCISVHITPLKLSVSYCYINIDWFMNFRFLNL